MYHVSVLFDTWFLEMLFNELNALVKSDKNKKKITENSGIF